MFKNSIELLDCALRELQVAIQEDKKEVEITLSNAFSGDVNEIAKLNKELKVMTVVEFLRKTHKDYFIKSIIGPKVNSQISVQVLQFSTVTYYPIVLKLSLQKK